MNSPGGVLRKPVGLGDAVKIVATPLAVILRKTGCAGCRRRQARLNKMVPDIFHPFA